MDDILKRYARDPATGQLIVDVAAARVEDLFQNFDRTAPYQKKDLDDDFAAYLVDCTREIGRRAFLVRIRLPALPVEALAQRVRSSVRNYFLYREASERRALVAVLRRCAVFLAAGLLLLAVSLLAFEPASATPSLFSGLFAQGMTIAAWVAVWQALATFLTEVPSRARVIGLYRRIAGAAVEFKTTSQASASVGAAHRASWEDSLRAGSDGANGADGLEPTGRSGVQRVLEVSHDERAGVAEHDP